MLNIFKKSTIRVQFINADNNETIGVSEMKPEQLPVSFSQPTTMHIQNEEWRVINAEPQDASLFNESKKLVLWLSKVEKVDLTHVRFSIPTVSNETPALQAEKTFTGFTLELPDDDWRQIEFLPLSLLTTIQEEMKEVEAIVCPDDGTEIKYGFDKVHVRSKIGLHHLNISLDKFCNDINSHDKASIHMTIYGETDYVKNGFAIKSPGYVYYGTIENNYIKELCLKNFESMDDEIETVCSKYSLVVVRWLEGSITTI